MCVLGADKEMDYATQAYTQNTCGDRLPFQMCWGQTFFFPLDPQMTL